MIPTTIDMPKIVQIRSYEEFTGKNYNFPEPELSIEDLLETVRGNSVSASYNSYAESADFGQITIPHKHNTSNPFRGDEPVVLPKTYLVNNFLEDKAIVFPKSQDNKEEIEEAFLRGVQPINHRHKVLFAQEIEIRTSELRRWRPNIVIDLILFDDDE